MNLNLLIENVVRETINEIIVKKMRGINSPTTGYGCGLPMLLSQEEYDKADERRKMGWVAVPRLQPVGLLAQDMGPGNVYLFDFHNDVLQQGNKILSDTGALYYGNRCDIRVKFNKGRFSSYVYYSEDDAAAEMVENEFNPPVEAPRRGRKRKV